MGANKVVTLGGLNYANDLFKWLQHQPHISQNDFAASPHLYNFNYCNDLPCWQQTLDPIAKQYPLVVGEFG